MASKTWVPTVITFALSLSVAALCVVALTTTSWYHSPTYTVGIPTDCKSQTIKVHGVDVSYCTTFSFANFKNNMERTIAGILMVVCLLCLCACSLMCYNSCSNTNSLMRFVFAASAFALATDCIIFAAYQHNKVPDDAVVGYSYYSVIIAAGLSLVASGFSTFGFSSSSQYEPILD